MTEESTKAREGLTGSRRLEMAAREVYEAWTFKEADSGKSRQQRLLKALLGAEPEDMQPLFHLLFPKQASFPYWSVRRMQKQVRGLLDFCERHEPEKAVWMVKQSWR